jgi:hypothetical protein
MRKTPIVLGIISMGLGALFGVGGVAALRTSSAQQTVVDRLCTAASIVISFALVVIGVGLARRAGWSRWAAIAWSIIAGLWLVVAMIREGLHAQASHEAMETWLFASLVPQVLDVIFPIAMLALLGRASARGDFIRGEPFDRVTRRSLKNRVAFDKHLSTSDRKPIMTTRPRRETAR